MRLFDRPAASPEEYFKTYSPARYPLFDIISHHRSKLSSSIDLVCMLKHCVTITQRDLAGQRHRISRCRKLSDHVLNSCAFISTSSNTTPSTARHSSNCSGPESSHFREYEPPTRVWQRSCKANLRRRGCAEVTMALLRRLGDPTGGGKLHRPNRGCHKRVCVLPRQTGCLTVVSGEMEMRCNWTLALAGGV